MKTECPACLRNERFATAVGGVCLFMFIGGLFGEGFMLLGSAFGFGFGYFISVWTQKLRKR